MKLTFDFEKILERKKNITVEKQINLNSEIFNRQPTYQAPNPFKISAILHPVQNRYVLVNLSIEGNIIVPSTRSLKPANVRVSQNITEIFMRESDDQQLDEDYNEPVITYVENNMIDLYNMIVDYILLSVPPQVLTSEEQKENIMPYGDEWQVMSESDFQHIKHDYRKLPNQEFSKLAALKNQLDEENNE